VDKFHVQARSDCQWGEVTRVGCHDVVPVLGKQDDRSIDDVEATGSGQEHACSPPKLFIERNDIDTSKRPGE
jgi:hypothetical protein